MRSKFAYETSHDRLLRYHKSELRKEPANLMRHDAKADTVLRRIVDKIFCAQIDIYRMQPGDVYAHNVDAFESYLLQKIYPLFEHDTATLHDLGWERMIAHLKKLKNGEEAVIL